MKKLKNPIALGGFPFTNEVILQTQDEIFDALNSGVLAGVAPNGCVLSGCEPSVSGSSVTIGSGYLYLNGDIIKFSGYSGVYPVYLKEGDPIVSQYMFEDGLPKDAVIEKTAVASAAIPGSGHYITFNPTPDKVFKTLITKDADPVGVIKMWAGSPTVFDGTGLGTGFLQGWALCNGNNGTLDMRGLFPVGYNPDVLDYDTVGKAGGEKEVTLSTIHLPSHSHTITGDKFGKEGSGTPIAGLNNLGDASKGSYTEETSSVGGGVAHENRPPYRVVCYIQKVA